MGSVLEKLFTFDVDGVAEERIMSGISGVPLVVMGGLLRLGGIRGRLKP